MSLPIELPVLQNWSCHNCGGCCRQHGIYITAAEKARIEAQGWTPEHGIPAAQPLFVRMRGGLKKAWHRLAHQPDGACVFLDERGLCRIHARFGEPAKPLACRIYPYAFHPAGSKITIGLRFSCPSVVANRGAAVASQRKELRELAEQVVPRGVQLTSPPLIAPGNPVSSWPDFLQFVGALEAILADDPEEPLAFLTRLLAALQFVDVLEQARFDRLTGGRIREFLEIVTDGVFEDIPERPEDVPEPGSVARTQFRLLAGHYARKDTYGSNDGTLRGRWKLLRSALALTRGRGMTPSLQPRLSPVPFEALEAPFGVPADSEELFTRYFQVKLHGMSFCGAAYYQAPLVEGFRSLALVYPAVLWISRWIAAGEGRDRLEASDVAEALAIADHHHGYSPAFGTWGFRKRVQNLSQRQEILRLCAWYSR